MPTVTIEVASPRQAHAEMNRLYRETVKPHTSTGARCRITFETVNPVYRHQLRKLLHGPMLRDFALQVRTLNLDTGNYERWAVAAWKILLKDLFCPPRFDEASGQEMARSTEALSDDDFAEFVLQCHAFGVLDLGVVFTELPTPEDLAWQ